MCFLPYKHRTHRVTQMTNSRPKLDVVIISTIRPDILEITLNSFKHKLLRSFDVRVIINVDPAGETSRYSQLDIVGICERYFDVVVSRISETASFSAAVQWCWRQVETDIFFHLEDDWLLKKQITPKNVLALFENDNVVSVTLNKRNQSISDTAYNDSESENSNVNNDYIRVRNLSLSPGFFRARYINELLSVFDITKDPENQFTGKGSTTSYPHPVFLRSNTKRRLVIDTGTKWRNSMAFRKWGNQPDIRWRKSNSRIDINKISRTIRYYIALSYWRKRYCVNIKSKKNR